MPENSSCSGASSCSKESCEGCSHNSQNPQSMLEAMNAYSNIKHVIGVVSGKGGVGKSFVTSSLAVQMAKAYAPFVRKIEIEVETLEQVKEAVEAGADIIMLDNMTPEVMKQAVELINGRAQTECSGNITKENIQKIREIGVDFVSSGALTHSAPILDISMKNLHAV